jgi:hypothetical protein
LRVLNVGNTSTKDGCIRRPAATLNLTLGRRRGRRWRATL